ncbi:beta-lactamase/transpeptidase-like protein [Dacryopinax primogenitus]|uniref:Beta-lactamase/transpeptidase-like protein n=1 Tax=Dacryopinax primogenitus (strain DJM 731) TaxID=1858805 RepID=M5G5H1_DACPD|nr:beta-lactamase/transpeptidase-like protein [Dacryopinax primogenitus]EJU03475.1 beta-lactamase/transpeptidase-like protein [Dacryopinax primogenitus]
MLWKIYLLSLTALVGASQLPLPGDTCTLRDHSVLPQLSKYINSLAKQFKIPGLSLAVVYADDDEPEYFNLGVRSEEGESSSEDTLYCIASNSKAFTATALGILIDDFEHGRNVTALPGGVEFGWKTKLADLLPDEWALKDQWASEKTNLIDMLSHVTGLPRHEFSYAPGETLQEMVETLRYLEPTFEFRERFQYNNMMYCTASYIIQKYSGQSHMSFVAERLFKPLGMNSSTFFPEVAFNSGMLAESWLDTAGPGFNETRRVPYFLPEWTEAVVALNAGPGGVISSARDLTHWVRTLLNEGTNPFTREQVIPKSVLDTVTVGHSMEAGKGMFPELSPTVYGGGWERWSYAGHEMIQHGGSVPGFSSAITLLPGDGVGILALSNGDGMGFILLALTARIMEELFSLPHIDWAGRFRNATADEEPHASEPVTGPSASETLAPISQFAGTYARPGYYGNLTLCAWPSDPTSACNAVLSDYALADPDFVSQNKTTLYAFWGRVFVSHVKLSQLSNTTFSLQADSLYVSGCGKDTSPFYVRRNPQGGALAEFGFRDSKVSGFGAWGLSAGPRERVPGQPETSSEAWFDKVE